MSRQQFYEPMLQEEQEMQQVQMRGFQVMIGGTYVLLDDVVTALRAYADSLNNQDAYAVREASIWLQAGNQQLPVPPEEPQAAVQPEEYPIDHRVDRVEIYPEDPEALRPKWIARSCDDEGNILFVTSGSFDQEYVIRNAEERWPGKPVHLVAHAGIDTVWEEAAPDATRGVHSNTRRPSPKRLWA